MEVKLPPQLIEEVHQNNTVLFVGAGLSMQAGFPGWEELMVHMIEWADNHGFIDSKEEREELEQLVKKGELLLVASELRELMTPLDYLTFMKSQFRDESKKPAAVHRLLPEIDFQAVLTTNYDVLLESAYTLPGSNRPRTYTQEDVAELATLNSKKEFYILKVHGDIDRIDTVVLGRRDYRKIMFENKAYRDFFKNLLQSRTVLFAGYGLKDPDLEMILNELASTFKGYGNCHYALMSDDSMGKIEKKRWRHDYNINTISYKATKGHPEVLRFFELLKDELEKKKTQTLSEKESINKHFFNESKILPQHFYEVTGYLDTISKKEKYLDRYYINLSGKAQQIAIDLESDFPDLLIPTEFEVLEKNSDDKPKDFKLLDDIEDVLKTHSRFILLGSPGSGKTKTLEKIFLSQARLARENLNLRIPLLIDLAEWESDNDDLSKLIKKNRDANGLPPLYFDQFILLFDGLNEMEAKRSDQRLETIKKWLELNPYAPVIFSCREKDYLNRKFTWLSLPEVKIHPLDNERISRFVKAYLGEDEGQQLYDLIKPEDDKKISGREFLSLAGNPYLLFMIIRTYHKHKKIPASTGQLFNEFVEVLYNRETQKKSTDISYEELISNFGKIAFAMINKRSGTKVHTAWALKRINLEISPDSPGTSKFPGSLLELGSRASLIKLSINDSIFQFTHQLLLEYFAAEELVKRIPDLDKFLGTPRFRNKERILNPWDEVIYILIGISDTNQTIQRISSVDPFLAFECVEKYVPEDVEIGEETFETVIKDLISRFASKNESAREASVETLVELGIRAVPYLAQTLTSSMAISRKTSLRALSKIKHSKAIESLILATENSNKFVRNEATRVVENFSPSWIIETIRLLNEKLADRNPLYKRIIIDILLIILDTNEEEIVNMIIDSISDRESAIFLAEVILLEADTDEIKYIFKQLYIFMSFPEEQLSPDRRSSLTFFINTVIDKMIDCYRDNCEYEVLSDSSWIIELIEEEIPAGNDEMEKENFHFLLDFHRIDRQFDYRFLTEALRLLLLCEYISLSGLIAESLLTSFEKAQNLLNDQDSIVRLSALKALSNLKAKINPDIFYPLLNDENPEVRVVALKALGNSDAAIKPDIFYPLLNDENPEVRVVALKALGNSDAAIKPDILYPLLNDENPEVRVVALKVVGNSDAAIKPDILYPLLKDKSKGIRWLVLKALRNSDAAIKPGIFYPLLNDKSSGVRIEALKALCNSDAAIKPDIFYPLLSDKNPEVRAEAQKTLCNSNVVIKPDIFYHLIGKSSEVKIGALQALNNSDVDIKPDVFYPLLKDKSKEIRRLALKALRNSDAAIKPDIFYPFLNDKSSGVRIKALKALCNSDAAIKPNIFYPLLKDKSKGIRRLALKALCDSDAAIKLDIFYPLLNDERPEVRMEALKELCNSNAAIKPGIFYPFLNDKSSGVRIEALKALCNFDAAIKPDIFYPLLKDKSKGIRRLALKALLDSDAAIKPDIFYPLLQDLSIGVRCHALIGIAAFGSASDGEKILPLLDDENPEVRRNGLSALGRLKYTLSNELIFKILDDNAEHHVVIYEAINYLTGTKNYEFLEKIKKLFFNKENHPSVRCAAINHLILSNNLYILEPLDKILDEEGDEVINQAIKSLCTLNSPGSNEIIRKLLNESGDKIETITKNVLSKLERDEKTSPENEKESGNQKRE